MHCLVNILKLLMFYGSDRRAALSPFSHRILGRNLLMLKAAK